MGSIWRAAILVLALMPVSFAQDETEAPPPPEMEEAPVAPPPQEAEPAPPPPPVESVPPSPGGGPTTVAPDIESESIPAPPGEEETAEESAEEAPKTAEPQPAAGSQPPDVYVIQPGDTLWDICAKFLGNPWYWPKLWSLNEYIQNPHLIYPGNEIRFFLGSEIAPPKLDIVKAPGTAPDEEEGAPPLEEAEEKKSEPAPVVEATAPEKISVRLKPISFVSESELKGAGEITHSGEPKRELTFGDRVYLKFSGRTVKNGEKFQAFEVVKPVKDCGSSKKKGYLIRKTAVIKILSCCQGTVEGLIVDSEDSIQRGARVVPYEPLVRMISPHDMEKSVDGRIIESEHQSYLISNNDYVFLNMGRAQGVNDGSRLVAVRQGDGLGTRGDKKLPDVVVGRLLVVATGDQTSTAYVTDLRDSLSVCDRVTSRDKCSSASSQSCGGP